MDNFIATDEKRKLLKTVDALFCINSLRFPLEYFAL